MVSIFRDLRVDEVDGADKAIGPGINHGGGSRIATRDRKTGDQQFSAPNDLTSAPGHKSGDASECGRLLLSGADVHFPLIGRGHTRGNSTGALSEREDRGLDVQQSSSSATAITRTSGSGQDGGDVHDQVQSGKRRGKSRCFSYTVVRIDRYY